MSDNANLKSNFQDFKLNDTGIAKKLAAQVIDSSLRVETDFNKVLNTINLQDAYSKINKSKFRLVSTIKLARKLNNHLLLEIDKIPLDFEIPITLNIADKILKLFYWVVINFDSHTINEIELLGLKEADLLYEEEEGMKSAEEEINSIKDLQQRESFCNLLLIIKSTFQADKALIKAIRASLLASSFVAQRRIEGKQVLFLYI
ncbi:hypothetical protein OY14_04540 (plasmid) [Borreliella chilensis]|uniref:Uncharacterized protein n=1 Tax=Borreliella chilensis TaxID=1245910 RepID=A0A0A7V3D8_9SPIR|nr:hypothetical protein OY14_04540 [Borreliella chilensis]